MHPRVAPQARRRAVRHHASGGTKPVGSSLELPAFDWMPGHTVPVHRFTNVKVAALPSAPKAVDSAHHYRNSITSKRNYSSTIELPLRKMQIRTRTATKLLAIPMSSKQCSSAWWVAMAIGSSKKRYIMSAQCSYKAISTSRGSPAPALLL